MDLRLCEYEFAKQGHVPQIVTAISPLHVLFFPSLCGLVINPVDLRDLSSFQSHTRIRFLYS